MKIISSEVVPKVRKANQSAKSAAAPGSASASQGIDSSRLEEMIAVAAYFRAEQRGFAPGDELDDWFQAEAEYLYRVDTVGKGN